MRSLEPSCSGGGRLQVPQGYGLQGVRARREVGGCGMPPVDSTRRRIARQERLERSCAAEKARVAGGGRRSTYCARGKAQYSSKNKAA